jgi:hypothetical protein
MEKCNFCKKSKKLYRYYKDLVCKDCYSEVVQNRITCFRCNDFFKVLLYKGQNCYNNKYLCCKCYEKIQKLTDDREESE